MKFIKEIKQKDIGIKDTGNKKCVYIRRNVRAVVFNKDCLIPLVFFRIDNYHSLPGGKIDDDETIEEALKREFLEEIGSEIIVTKPIGVIVTYEYYARTVQINFCYKGNIIGEAIKTKPTNEEKEQKPVIKWVELEKAVMLLKNDQPVSNIGKFNSRRDLAFIEEI